MTTASQQDQEQQQEPPVPKENSSASMKEFFNKDRAASYEDGFQKVAPFRNAMHLCIQMAWSSTTSSNSSSSSSSLLLPEDAHILCVGAGTGLEIQYLANLFPKWRFTAIDPAAPMLAICQQKAESLGFASRCSFFEGYLNDYIVAQQQQQGEGSKELLFDAATCLLVSHFILDQNERRQLYQDIASCLKPGGQLIVADLAMEGTAVLSNNDYQQNGQHLYQIWMDTMKTCFDTLEQFIEYETMFQQKVALLPPSKVAAIIASGGFDPPHLICQTYLIHTWLATKSASDSIVH